jgi:hypothetical protein
MRLTTSSRRGDYNPVSSSPSAEEEDGGVLASTTAITAREDDEEEENQQQHRQQLLLETVSTEDTPLRESIGITVAANPNKISSSSDEDDEDDDSDDEDVFEDEHDGGTTKTGRAATSPPNTITVVVLDSAQKRFPIHNVNPNWYVSKFMRMGAKVHKVPPQQQRLIFRGKMLSTDPIVSKDDDKDESKKKRKKFKTLRDYGIHTDNDLIVHLFPKPRVVLTTSSSAVTNASTTSSSHGGAVDGGGSGDASSGGGAHIPSIVIDQEEQQRRGQILVLGSVEIAESQNNVKVLSLMLFVISAMRLLALFSIAMGVADENQPNQNNNPYNDDTIPTPSAENSTDDGNHGHHGGSDPNDPSSYTVEQRTWKNVDYFDLVVSLVGFYVATLGMKATQENTLRLANGYFIGTIVAGVLWNAFNVFGMIMFYKEETDPTMQDDQDDDMPTLSADDMVTLAFITVGLPCMVWGLCWARAFEFRRLIEEAEHEAAERIRSQMQPPQQQQREAPAGGRSGRRNRNNRRSNRPNRPGVSGQELDELRPPSSSNNPRQDPPEIV